MVLSIFTQYTQPDKHFLSFNLKYLFLVGLWPSENFTKTQKILYFLYEFLINALTILFLIVSGIGIYQIRKDVPALLKNLVEVVVAYKFCFKAIFLTLKRGQLKEVIDEIQANGDTVTEKRVIVMIKFAIAVTIMSSSIVGTFCIIATHDRVLAVEIWVPYDSKSSLWRLILTILISCILFYPSLLRGSSMQGLVCSLLMYMKDQLKEMQNTIENLKYSKDTEVEMRMILKDVILKHIRLMRYAANMEQIFREYFLFQNFAISMELCITAVMVTAVRQITLSLTFMSYLTYALVSNYIYSYLGHLMITESEAVALAAYNSSWPSWPVNLQKDLLILMRVAQRPLKLSAGGFTAISVECFAQTVYRGYSVFAVLSE